MSYEPEKLASCYQRSLQIAAENGIETIAFPAISTGVYGYPKKEAAQIAINQTVKFLNENKQIKKAFKKEKFNYFKWSSI